MLILDSNNTITFTKPTNLVKNELRFYLGDNLNDGTSITEWQFYKNSIETGFKFDRVLSTIILNNAKFIITRNLDEATSVWHYNFDIIDIRNKSRLNHFDSSLHEQIDASDLNTSCWISSNEPNTFYLLKKTSDEL